MTHAQLSPAPPETATEVYVFEQFGLGRTTVLALGGAARGYEVVDDWSGASAGAEPRAASIVYFDGPVTPIAYAAAEHAARDRIQPALRDLPGLIRSLTLWDAQACAVAVVHLAESVEALERAGKVINSTTLLPDEDPALLPGPDRGDVHRVVDHTRKAPS